MQHGLAAHSQTGGEFAYGEAGQVSALEQPQVPATHRSLPSWVQSSFRAHSQLWLAVLQVETPVA
jgi:hypothetical protein